MEVNKWLANKYSLCREYVAVLHFKPAAIFLMLTLLFTQACGQPAWSTTQRTDASTIEAIDAGTSTPLAVPTRTIIHPQPQEIADPSTNHPATPPSPQPVVFAVIGDYGGADAETGEVASMMLSWQPDFIITVGDNNYPKGAADHIDTAVGQYFHSYIYPYQGIYGAGAEINRFFPSLGNHDVRTDDGQPYFDYFVLPGNERYYDFVWGPVHLFALNTHSSEPDGYRASSDQAVWLQEMLADSTSTWNIVYGHYSPYSSGERGSVKQARWPFAKWGVDAVLSAHDHTYERLLVDGVTYIINGLGGYSIYNFEHLLQESQAHYNDDYGALRVEATDEYLLFQFFNRKYELVDQVELRK